ncbi:MULTISPECIES: hypothetical protein [unclassified Pseudomonas]|uniref:hypothetical protein n=1 Tax=unclassified Pseudomonas TaxID=196821 RepID=UPI00257A83C9|nr:MULTISPECIES: hypothetical protein [unclassified Pseudomonas]
MTKIFAILAEFILLEDCTSVPMAHPQEDAQMNRFETNADKSRIYIYRNETMGAAIQPHAQRHRERYLPCRRSDAR